MVHDKDHHAVRGYLFQFLGVLKVDDHFVYEVQEEIGDPVADLVIGEQVEERYDLLDVFLNLVLHFLDLHALFLCMADDGLVDLAVVQQVLLHCDLVHELVFVQADFVLLQIVPDRAVEPAPYPGKENSTQYLI